MTRVFSKNADMLLFPPWPPQNCPVFFLRLTVAGSSSSLPNTVDVSIFELEARFFGGSKIEPRKWMIFFPKRRDRFIKRKGGWKSSSPHLFLEWFFAKLLVFEAANLFLEILQAFIYSQGSLNARHFGENKQGKCMLILRNFPIIIDGQISSRPNCRLVIPCGEEQGNPPPKCS